MLDHYDIPFINDEQREIDKHLIISTQDIDQSLNSMKSDSAPGPDNVLVRTL